MNIVKYMIKKIKDCTKKEIFNAIFNDGQTSVGDDNCRFCKYQRDFPLNEITDIISCTEINYYKCLKKEEEDE